MLIRLSVKHWGVVTEWNLRKSIVIPGEMTRDVHLQGGRRNAVALRMGCLSEIEAATSHGGVFVLSASSGIAGMDTNGLHSASLRMASGSSTVVIDGTWRVVERRSVLIYSKVVVKGRGCVILNESVVVVWTIGARGKLRHVDNKRRYVRAEISGVVSGLDTAYLVHLA